MVGNVVFVDVALSGQEGRLHRGEMETPMNTLKFVRTLLLLGGLLVTLQGFAETNAGAARPPVLHDGEHDFDFEFGTWKTHLRRLKNPLSGSTTWIEYEGLTVCTKVWGGRANLIELIADSAAGRFEGASLRLYNPESKQWSLNFASVRGGTMVLPAIGEFKDGRGEFYNQDTFNGRSIIVRFIIHDITPDSCHFEQAFSADGGQTWEVNWIATDTRIKE